MATYPIRPVTEDELAGFLAVDQHASHGTPMSGRARGNLLARLDLGRTLAAFDGGTIVGGTGAFSFQMRVPGVLAAMRPVDDPLLYLLADPRRVRSVVNDGLWARLVDVPSALAQRHYACPVEVVIEVADQLCPQNTGRWRLATEAAAAPAGFRATCERPPPRLTLCCRWGRWAPPTSAAPGSGPWPRRDWSPRRRQVPSRRCAPRCRGNRHPGAP